MIGHGFWFGPGWGIVSGFLWVAFWVLVVLIVAGPVRGRTSGPAGSSALRILEERYARGEISREEFLERRAVLRGHRDRAPTSPA